MTYSRNFTRHEFRQVETGKLAKQAGRLRHRAIRRLGGTRHRLPSANAREGIDFLPLTVDYREYTYASGRIPGGFFKREGKPAEKEVLTYRVIDRRSGPFSRGLALRDADHHAGALGRRENDPTCSRSPALPRRSPFRHPVPEADRRRSRRLVDGQYVINPTFEQRKVSKLDLSWPAARTAW